MILKKIFIDVTVQSHPETQRICRRLDLPTERVDDPAALYQWINSAADPIGRGKQVLYLTRNKGGFLKPCPGTREYTCCGYQILHVASFCGMDCSYCILQSYFHPPLLQFFVNREDLDPELTGLFQKRTISRIGTGEFTDSLIWEPWTDLTDYLVSRFAAQDKAVLELKTKTVNIERLKGLDHRSKTILSWSLNTPAVMRAEERRTAPLDARLAAAARCQSWGYPLAFHFDPMVIYPGCESDYRKVVKRLFAHIRPERIVWISLGTFRFMPSLKPIIAQRFPDSKITYGEFVTGLDNKMRYFKPLRIALYRQMVTWIRKAAPELTVYFCMEDDEVWQKTLGFYPLGDDGLAKMLDDSAIRLCGLTP
ncbi:radical SAM protein [Desulfosarcina sp.]|uniref:SPL family radical SAM protein n=1 Tax=Desulfosarcina sp. TaxID=2027861 RepID=UPI003970963B